MNCSTGIILAAGEGKRMKSSLPKVLHSVCGKPMAACVTDALQAAGVQDIIMVVGHGADQVKESFKDRDMRFALQTEQLGTGHAVMQVENMLPDSGDVLILCGDTPLITEDTLKAFVVQHDRQENDVTILTAAVENPYGYGRIIRDETGRVNCIVEQKDADVTQKCVKEINSGMYCFDSNFLKNNLHRLNTDNAQKEYYITDLISIAASEGKGAGAYIVEDNDEILGVNDRVQLAQAEKIMRNRINISHMRNGVTLIDPDATYIDLDVAIGVDTIIYPGAIIKGKSVIGRECVIGQNCRFENAIIGDETDIQISTIIDSSVGNNTHVGPYAYMRPGSKVGNNCKVGDFVEIKNASLGNGSKSAHLAYVGDADVGENVNIGCGVVFVNYDGVHKHRSIVKDRAFVGSNANVVAPVTIEEDAYIAAGTTVTTDIEAGALCVGRTREQQISGWVEEKGLLRK